MFKYINFNYPLSKTEIFDDQSDEITCVSASLSWIELSLITFNLSLERDQNVADNIFLYIRYFIKNCSYFMAEHIDRERFMEFLEDIALHIESSGNPEFKQIYYKQIIEKYEEYNLLNNFL